ncbi:MAG: type II toxin-antitoxin system VapC family toxin [Candidatus Atribacteria bacterium]|nr:type II toxin-antitoxin system VapC family toxin [Candidatus Atribacteria bacterium]
MEIVIDASVLVDIWVKSRPRHQIACKLAKYIKEQHIDVFIPMHALLELKCAIDNERQSPGKGDLSKKIFNKNEPLEINTISIDQSFIKNYLDLSVPYIKAGDLPYILIAKKKKSYLLTEDKEQYKVASSVGITAFKIKEFLDTKNS